MTVLTPTILSVGKFSRNWLQNIWTLAGSVLLLVALLDPQNFQPVTAFAVKAFLSTLPYILSAVFLIAALKAAGAESAIAGVFAGRENRMIVLAALFGGLAPFCSCEVIPFIAGLLAVGAPLSAIMAFWLSSPLIDPPTILITAAALGWPFAIGKAASAVFIGLAGGFLVKTIVSFGGLANPAVRVSNPSCCGSGNEPNQPEWKFWRSGSRRAVFRREFLGNMVFLAKWLCLAYVLEAILITYVPATLIAGLVGGEGLLSIMVAAIVGMPAYLNSYVAPALVAGLMDQGMTSGAAMAFLVAGAVSSIPAMAAVWSIVRWQVFATYIGLGLSGAIVSGVVFQMVL